MGEAILVINAGSSSIKFSLFDAADRQADLHVIATGQVEGIGAQPRFIAKDTNKSVLAEKVWASEDEADRDSLLAELLAWIQDYLGTTRLKAAGHRVVLGGDRCRTPVRITETVMEALTALIPLVPLHQPANLAPIQSIARLNPQLPQVACFDTAFHSTIPPLAQHYGLPRALTDAGVRGYGFHGLSYEYIASELPNYDPKAAKGRTVAAHLGNGASLCALVNGKSVACTLGFSTLDGLLMGTRPGALDPGILLYLLQEKGMDAQAIERLLYQESGLLGVSGISHDMRDLLASSSPHAKEAVDLFIYRAARALGSMAAAAGGLDGLVFTAGIGEHTPQVRAGICEQAAWLGVKLDKAANERGGPRISAVDSPVSVWVIPTNEELMIARDTRAVVAN
jgi:acetate kinase